MAKIFIVDDNSDLLNLFSTIITRSGNESITVTSLETIMQDLLLYNPDLIILDLRLNGYDGKDLCKKIKANQTTNHIPIILTSASPELLRNFKDCQADDILEKPFNVHTLLNKIEALLKKAMA